MLRFALTVAPPSSSCRAPASTACAWRWSASGSPGLLRPAPVPLPLSLRARRTRRCRMARARELRSVRRQRPGLKVYGSLIGHLLLRTLDRAQRIHLAMLSRGFDGEFRSEPARSASAGGRRLHRSAGARFLPASLRWQSAPRLGGRSVTGVMHMSHHIVEVKDLSYAYPDGTAGYTGRLLPHRPRRVGGHRGRQRRRQVHAAAAPQRLSCTRRAGTVRIGDYPAHPGDAAARSGAPWAWSSRTRTTSSSCRRSTRTWPSAR